MEKKILYAEDDGDMLEVVSEFMRFEDYEVIGDDGKSIWKKVAQHPIGLILLDEILDCCWGSDLCTLLKSDEQTAGIPVILISAVRKIDEIAERCGADGYIRKPFDIYDVIAIVAAHYRQPSRSKLAIRKD